MNDTFAPITAADAARIDRVAVEDFHVPSILLMENAGRSCVDLLQHLGATGPVVVCCGKGNNGGDGFVIARHLLVREIPVHVHLAVEPQLLSGDARLCWRMAESAGVQIDIATGMTWDSIGQRLKSAEWVVDALLGTGIQGPPREPFSQWIQMINDHANQVLAVDLPSGLDADSGAASVAVAAHVTGTFVRPKMGLTCGQGPRLAGKIHVLDIGITKVVVESALRDARERG